MRPGRRARRHGARERLRRGGCGGRGARGAPARDRRRDRRACRRPLQPRRGQRAREPAPHRQRRLRRAGPAAGLDFRRLAQRQPHRRARLARQGARGRVRGAGLRRQRGGPVDRRDLRGHARRPRHPRLPAVPRDDPPRRGPARLRAGGCRARQAGDRLQAGALRGSRGTRGLAHRRARRGGRRRRRVPARLRHRPRRDDRCPDRGTAHRSRGCR